MDKTREQVIRAANYAIEHSPRWRDILSDWRAGAGDYEALPITTKDVLYGGGGGDPASMLVSGALAQVSTLYFSSGSSGRARSWTAHTSASLAAQRRSLGEALAQLWGIEAGRSTLLINMLPGGLSVELAGVTALSVGPDVEIAAELLSRWAASYEVVLLVAEPWCAKAALEAAAGRVALERLDLRVAVGGELLPESLRGHLLRLMGRPPDTREPRVLSSMGCSEVGLQVLWETPATAALRRVLADDAELRARLCGAALEVAPCLMTYDPGRVFIEFVDEELTLSCLEVERALPLIRYGLGDRGGAVSLEAARAVLAARDPQLAGALPDPLVWVAGRRDEPQTPVIAEALGSCGALLGRLTGGFMLDAARDRLLVQLAGEGLGRATRVELRTRLQLELARRGLAGLRIELHERSTYPHPDAPWMTKFQRRAR